MKGFCHSLVTLGVLLPLLGACEPEAAMRPPSILTRAAIGHYCNMIVADHPGPKAQVHEKQRKEPLWFSSVRDALVYLRLPGEAQGVIAVYVHDMAKAESWETPQKSGIWIKASDANYVIDSKRRGGMGAREAAPFSDKNAAAKFIDQYGGRIVTYDEIPDDYVLGDRGEHGGGVTNTSAPGSRSHRGSHGAGANSSQESSKGR